VSHYNSQCSRHPRKAKKHVPFKYTHAALAPLVDQGAQPTLTAAPSLEIRAGWAPGPSGQTSGGSGSDFVGLGWAGEAGPGASGATPA
jgi:hypothetical protein